MKKQEVISQVQNSLGSLFTKDDVVNCLNMVSEETKAEVVQTDVDSLFSRIQNGLTKVMDEIDFNDSDNFEIDNIEFDIRYGNQIELDSYEIYANQLKDLVRDEIAEFLSNLRNEMEEEKEAKEEAMQEN